MPDPALADLTTLRLGGPARRYVAAPDADALVAAVSEADAAGEPVLLVGGGSNLVVADEGFAGTVVHLTGGGVRVEDDACGVTTVTVAAGEPWDDFVARAVAEGWPGVEALSGIPGTAGATPVQNVGAYGQEVAQTIARVRVWDRVLRGQRTFTAAECQFAYRHSRFKADPARHLVLDVTFELHPGELSTPVAYAELARTLGVEPGGRAPLADVREAVLGLRRGKGMVLDAADHDTWSAGSFFTNPFVEPSRVPEGAPSYPQADGSVKTSAAWLIEHAGFGKGHGLDRPGARVSLSTKHTLALTNRGGATTAELLDLAREVRDGVRERFGITLVNEPVLVGATL
ncbi:MULTISPECIES: UDP-N-acetylmuramate dehydrogenase [unclassified Nocardioides]|uniref:UDP-N-acetylmuramate dehydrogenase n=1 Tax=unclassified Nocardioides TaxID=2615069 RepID=UPI0007025E2E|nr:MULTISPECIES: UDP-N-acetylmuramate dehydrogenase [unclassified Nocardioides]KRC52713.1 UDP-N-acetylenolpyruvoylglucosamine reductase [Nocardioides sp. Root79]KRC72245.1 UDP-N-acetylenolpyruvoylglucosamine reductase [Nocardioides sp. Root240]